MPDATQGVPVWRIQTGQIDNIDDCGNISESATYAHEHVAKEAAFDGYTCEPGTWYPADEAGQRQEVIDAASEYRGHLDSAASKVTVERALVRLCLAVDTLRLPPQQPPSDDGEWMRGVG